MSRSRFYPEGVKAGWNGVLTDFFNSDEGKALLAFLQEREVAGATIYPPDPFRVLRLIDPSEVRVVILGQDPYHGPGQATGMAFSVPESLKKLPPSLKNIFKEIAREFDVPVSTVGDLTPWVEEGVLLLNAVLTVEQASAGSHAGRGWETLTDRLLATVLKQGNPCVFMLWGAWAQKKIDLIERYKTGPVEVLQSNHPSPLSALRPPLPFIGCDHFKAADDWLVEQGLTPVDWVLKAHCRNVSLF